MRVVDQQVASGVIWDYHAVYFIAIESHATRSSRDVGTEMHRS